MAEILILAAHPDLAQSHITHRMLEVAAGMPNVAVRDLYRLYPDYALDVPAEQAALAEAGLVILLHPLHWYSMPGLLKLWVDEVLRFGWAYGPGGEALRGKSLWLVTSTGGSADSYSAAGHNAHPLEAFLMPYAQSARLCGMAFLPPLVLHGAHRVEDAELEAHAAIFAARLKGYPNWVAKEAVRAPEIELDARPALFSPLERNA